MKRNKDGTFKKGHSGNPDGKPKGAVSEKTRIWNELAEWFRGDGIEAYQELLMEKMESDDPKEKQDAMVRFEAMLEYFQPKLARTELKAADEDKDLSIKVEYVNSPKE